MLERVCVVQRESELMLICIFEIFLGCNVDDGSKVFPLTILNK